MCSLPATNFNQLTNTYSRSAVILLVIRQIDSSWAAATLCLSFYLSCVSIFSLGTRLPHWGTPLISFGAWSQAGPGETTTGILKEYRPCRHRVCPCGSAMPFSQGSQPLQKKPSLNQSKTKLCHSKPQVCRLKVRRLIQLWGKRCWFC